MASPALAPEEDPLTAALPPTTDYMTYLTILEYRLKPRNLNVLNGILSADDGTLAKEIGWDLLRLVLPMLTDVPDDAAQCLDSIARRGNPREVVVRVAEELEKLGRQDAETDEDDEENKDNDLPTFSGEATRIHLGEMKLDGMPDTEHSASPLDGKDLGGPASGATNVALEAAQLPALLNILSTVHPRIKTQYPSRFLATSLPAALAAYRRMPVTYETTVAFLQCLEKLGSRQRPALPPRQSTTGSIITQPIDPSLPDPEAPAEASQGSNIASPLEKSIVSRLLQAVTLEVLEEYAASWHGHDLPSMLWTKRLREQLGGDKVTRKITATELFEGPPLKERDILVQKFRELSKTLGLDPRTGIKEDKNEHRNGETAEGSEEPSEYPTKPSQIPFSRTASLLLLAAENFSDINDRPVLGLDVVLSLFHTLTPLSETPRLPSPGLQDALHSLLYTGIEISPTAFVNGSDSSQFIALMSILTQTFTITPDPQSRDDAHYIATKLLRGRESVDDRISIVKQTIRCRTPALADAPSVPLATPFTEGALRAIGVNWLKDSILASLTADASINESAGVDPARLETDRELNDLIWHPTIPSPTDTHLVSTVLMELPYYMALLNLSSVLINRVSLAAQPSVLKNARALLQHLTPWRDQLVDQLGTDDEVKASAPEIYAFEDAVARVKEAIAAKDNQD